jgi:hypothetical protein
MKIAALAVCVAALALGACRRETPVDSYEPMKLGVTVDQSDLRK